MVVRDIHRNLVERFILSAFENGIDDACAFRCVLLHLIEFFRRKLSGLSQDCIIDSDLAEIVHRRRLDHVPAELVCQAVPAKENKDVLLV